MIRLAERSAAVRGDGLLIGHLLRTPLATAPAQQIVYRDERRHSYRDLAARVARLAGGLHGLGVRPGTTVAVLDWDSHRYLECFFAVPMMGAVLQTVNVRFTPDQIAYTLQHAGAEVVLVHRDFLPVLRKIRGRLPAVRTILLIERGSSISAMICFSRLRSEAELILREMPPPWLVLGISTQ